MRRKQRGDNSWKHLFRRGIVLSFILFTCCISPHEIHTTDLNPNGWKDGAEVIFENQDTTTERSLYIIARLRQDFGYDQLRVAVTTTTPKGYKWHDTLSIRTFDTPPASGLYFDREELLRTKMVLAQPGRYLFTFTPLMPQPDDPDEAARQTEEGITGVAAVGIDIR